MCGIAGIWGISDHEVVKRMLLAIHHRGPDNLGIFADQQISMGMVRLAILDTSAGANQPMISECGNIILVYNGEIYNFRELKNTLIEFGHVFKTTSDTEVVLKAYQQYGDSCLSFFNGMYSLAIYDKRMVHSSERLLLARDPFGIKPLLYSIVAGKVVFGSELKALLKSGHVDKKIDPQAMRSLFNYGSVRQPQSLVQNVRMLLPGHKLIIEKGHGHPQIEKFATDFFSIDREISKMAYQEQIEVTKAALVNSVRSQLVSDVPLGAFLSGGIDSSLVTAIMTQIEGRDVKTFSVGFESEGSSFDESDDAERIADYLTTDHHKVIVTGSDFKQQFLQIIRSLDQPTVDGVNSYFVSQAAAKGVTVALSGTGGDELFAGYPWVVNMLQYVDRYEASSKTEKIMANISSSRLFDPVAHNSNRFNHILESHRAKSSFLSAFSRQYFINSTSAVKSLFADRINDGISYPSDMSDDYEGIDELIDSSVLNRVSALCINGYLRNQLLRDIDATSMSHSLEVRVPFLDRDVLRVALSISDSAKVSESIAGKDAYLNSYRELGTKKVLVDIGKQYLPRDYDLQPKRGFRIPYEHWLKEYLEEEVSEAFGEDTIRKRGFFNYSETSAIFNQYKSGNFGWPQIWLVVVFEFWCREYIDD